MMARSKCSNQRPDTLMQDRSPPARRNHLQRTAGPYIWVIRFILTVRPRLPLYPDNRTSSASAASSQKCHFRTHALRQKHATRSPRRHAREMLRIGTARACTAPKVQGRQYPPLQIEARGHLPRSQQRLPRAGELELSYSRGAPYGVTHAQFAIVSGSALASKSPPCWEAKIPPRSHERLEFDH